MPYRLYEKMYQVVQQVPAGQVATYGDIAHVVGGGCDARTVGQALNEIPKQRAQAIPWQRIINRAGGISTRGLLQQQLLEEEGIGFNADGCVDMRRFRWRGPEAAWAEAHGFHTLPPPPDEDAAEQLTMF